VTKIEIEEENGTTVVHRTADYTPPRSWRTWLIGRPLPTADAPHQTIRKIVGLAVFASDALSSTAYATQEMLVVLAAAGTAAFGYAFPISIAIVVLLAIVTISYEQTIHAYPGGGGAYIVARDNLGELPAQTAGAALLTDYILTVAVSISSGVAQLVSAYPALYPSRVAIAVGLVMFVMLINLRGVRESGAAFAIPSYFFVVMMVLTVGVGFVRYLAGSLGTVADPPMPMENFGTVQAVTLFVILRAFSSGTTAMTGVEAISNGVPAFREPKSRNAGITLIWMSSILGVLLMAITFLAGQIGAVPSEKETVISQLARTAYAGEGVLYLAIIAGTTVILILAANTSFAGFPRLSALLAVDGFLPRQLAFQGSRLVYSRGIAALGLIACVLIAVFRASVTALIPLYAIGVFLSFTLSQAGMARRWFKIGHLAPGQEVRERGSTLRYEPSWQLKMVSNGVGAVATATVTLIFAVTKFRDGAWTVILLMPVLVFAFPRSPSLPGSGKAPVAGGLWDAATGSPASGDPAAQRGAPGYPGCLALCSAVVGRRDGGTRVDRPNRGKADKGQVGIVGRRGTAGNPGFPVPAAAGAAAWLHRGGSSATPAKRDDHNSSAPVRAEAAVDQPAPHPNGLYAAHGAAVQTRDRHHRCPIPGGIARGTNECDCRRLWPGGS